MKIARLILNFLIMAVMIGLVFLDSIKTVDDIKNAAANLKTPELVYQTVSYSFISAQGTCYINIISALMVGILFVALECNIFFI